MDIPTLTFTVGALERFEDTEDIGIFTLINDIPDAWRVKRLRTLLRVSTPSSVTDADIDVLLATRLSDVYLSIQSALIDALQPDAEAEEVLSSGEKVAVTTDGNFPPAGSSSG